MSSLMFLPTGEQAPHGPRTLRLDLYNKFPCCKQRYILYKLRIAPCFALPQSYRHSHFRAACASLRAHTCCLRNRIQSLTRASRATILSAFSKSLYSKRPIHRATHCISPRVTSLLRSFRAANRYSHSRVASHRSMLIPVVVANVLAHW